MTPKNPSSHSSSERASGPSSGSVLGAMRPLLRVVIPRPGKLYNPVYFGPLKQGDALEAEARHLAREAGVPFFTARERAFMESSWRQDAAGVFFGSVEEILPLIASSGGAIPAFHQIILWGTEPAETLPGALRQLVEAGMAIDPVGHAREHPSDPSLALACARCAQSPGTSGNPLVLFGSSAALPLVVEEVALRLEAGGLSPVLTFGDPRAISPGELSSVGVGGAVVLRVISSTGGHEWVPGISELLERGVQVVLAADTRLREESRSTPVGGLLASGIALSVENESAQITSSQSVRRWDRSSHWPPLSDVLAGAPVVGPDASRVLSAQAGVGAGRSFSFEDLLQLVSSGQLTGRLVVYTATEIGTLIFDEGSLVGATLEDDRWDLDKLLARRPPRDRVALPPAHRALVEHRALSIGSWKGTQMVFVTGGNFPEAETSGVSISADKFVYDLAMWLDESPRSTRKVGGMKRIWKRAELVVDSLPAAATHLLAFLNGQWTLEQASEAAGLLNPEVLSAMSSLIDAGAIELVSEAEEAEPSLPPERVAGALAQWGLVPEARALLEGLIEGRPALLSGGEWFLLGHLRAGTDSAGASAAFRRAVEHLGREGTQGASRKRLVDALLNVLLIETRSRAIAADVAWETFAQKIEPGARREIGSSQHLAIITELALRAGDENSGRIWIDRLRADPRPEAKGLVGALERVTRS